MSKLLVRGNQIVLESEDKIYYPTARDVFNASNNIIIDGIVFDNKKEELGLKFSKISLTAQVEFALNNDSVILNLFVIKNSEKYYIQNDYLIVNNNFYFISNYEIIFDILNKNNCNNGQISLINYVEVCRDLTINNIDFIDNVNSNLKELKEDEAKNIIGLNAKLFKYQQKGFNWLTYMYQNRCGCILGDEMGLGKTLQVIALMGFVKENYNNSKFLIVAPVSLLENWKRELKKFYPKLTVLVHHGTNRTGDYGVLLNYDVVITSYANAQSDLSMFNMINWDVLAVDEAQNIKNPYSKRAQILKLIKRKMSVAITGTPFENHMTDIWSLTDFVLPKYLGDLNYFKKTYLDDVESAVMVEKFVSPIMLRRLVKEVAKDLPERVDIPQAIIMSDEEAKYYSEDLKSINKNDLKLLEIEKIQRLRMFCTHPFVYRDDLVETDPLCVSSKYERLVEILSEIITSKEKVLIFTSFNEMIDIMSSDLKSRFNVNVRIINGSVSPSKRQDIIDDFSKEKGASILLLNPRAAGAGLNITAANHVIHYNLEWNPAVEDQASARAFRRGQEKTVFIHRLFYVDTIEDVINERIERKRDISNVLIVGNKGDVDKKDLLKVLSISPQFGGNYD